MRYIIEHDNSAVAVHDNGLRYIYVSHRYLDRYKVKEADVIGRHHYDVFPDLPQKWRDVHQKALAGEVCRSERDAYPREDGTLDWTRWECRPWYEADGSIGGIVVYTEVITEWVAAEEALRKSEEHLNFVLQMSKTGGWELDLADETAYRTLEHDRIFGYESMLPEWTYQMFLDHVVPEDRPEVERRFKEAKASQTDWDFECRICRSDGEIRWIRAAGQHLPEKTGGRRKMSGIVQDITDRKEAEEEKDRLNAQLIQSQKMESVGQLAGGVAHDFNNMLSIINGYAEISVEMLSAEDPLYSNLREIHTAGKRSAGIVRQLLAFARQQTSTPVSLDLSYTISSMLKMLQRLIGENIDLVWHPSGSLWQVKIDPSQVDQIMANLAVNARDAISDVGKLTIETKNISFDQQYCKTHAGFIPGQYVMLAVSDNGCGMDKATMDNIFEPFFTTKEIGKGTGLGLPTVYGIVKQNNGFINVYSEPGQGTTFTIYLPRNKAQGVVTKPAKQSGTQMPAGSETILIVEDETAILQLVEGMLEKLGYTVLTAENPGDALKLAEKHEGTIQLLITDVIMPEMNGRDLAARLSFCNPAVKNLYMSGYTADVIAHHGVLEQGVHFIQKPFSIQDLAVKVREAIE
jgi:PAS domain S-box-containing protein